MLVGISNVQFSGHIGDCGYSCMCAWLFWAMVCECIYVKSTHWKDANCFHWYFSQTISTQMQQRPSAVENRPTSPNWLKATRTLTSYQRERRKTEKHQLATKFMQEWRMLDQNEVTDCILWIYRYISWAGPGYLNMLEIAWINNKSRRKTATKEIHSYQHLNNFWKVRLSASSLFFERSKMVLVLGITSSCCCCSVWFSCFCFIFTFDCFVL